jgi:methylmalonyl-CoA/ethylmalonyl-CoA epimerase
MLKRIHHVGIVVPSLEAALSLWRDALGLHLTKSEIVQDQGVTAALLRAGESEIELLEPLNPENGVGKFLARRGGGLHAADSITSVSRPPTSALNSRPRAPREFH